MSQSELDKAAYDLAKEFVLERITPEALDRELHIPAYRPETLEELYQALLESAQNANMKPRVIGGSIHGVHNLGPVLCDFEPALVLEKYSSGWEKVFNDIVDQLNPTGKVNRTPRSLWPKYCQTILSGAKFLAQFSSAEHFYEWVSFFDNKQARLALPLLVAEEVDGLGFALACDFLKGLGYGNFSKPDVHIKEIFPALGFCPFKASDYEVFKAVDRVALNVGVSPYSVDKLFWLIGSRAFGSRKKEFIAMVGQRWSECGTEGQIGA